MKSLVIVESPAKVKSISKYLGKDFIVKSSIGHIRDLPKTGSKLPVTPTKEHTDKVKTLGTTLKKMGIDPYNGWSAEYDILPGKEKVLKSLRDEAKRCSVIYLATDLDREGEAIAWHLKEAIGGKNIQYKRVTFAEITKSAIEKAFEKPTELDLNKVEAQQTRRFLDRLVGYLLSPLLWQKVARGLSAGRVQSVAVKLISEREKEIHAFKTDEYWEIKALFCEQKMDFTAQVLKEEGKAFRPNSKESTDRALKLLGSSPYIISKIDQKQGNQKPQAPFITSTLQQAASLKLGYGVKKTMILAQKLYEAGYITYMRTDSTNISQDAINQARDYIEESFGKKYLPPEPVAYSSKKSAQEAHEAIRPTNVHTRGENLSDMEVDAIRVYELVWRQFLACQMMPTIYDSTTITIKNGNFELKARGRVLKFDGFLKVMPQVKSKQDDDVLLPKLAESTSLDPKEIKPTQHFTKPPARFTEASLVRELEKQGIGRPSTYASIISTIQERGYVFVEKRRFFCLKMGEIVADRLSESFKELMDYGFTASMEEHLDKIASGEENWKDILNAFYEDFLDKLSIASISMRSNDPTETDVKCPECKRNMCIRTARTGVFLSCSGYMLPVKERCKGTINLVHGDDFEAYNEDDDVGNIGEIQKMRRCKKCDTAMDHYVIDEKRKLHVCGNNPDCNGFEIEQGAFKVKGYDGPSIDCDKCGGIMQLKTGRFGKYFACNSAPECKNTRKLLKSGEAAPPKADAIHMTELKCEQSEGYFILRDGASGLFLASSLFPKSRETKKPRVLDLVRHKEKLDPKFDHIVKAPTHDPKGLETIIRFSKKAKEHFVMSEENGKPTSWAVFWNDGKWQEKK